MVRVIFHTDLAAFTQRVRPFLLQREATYNLMLGVLSDLARGRYADVWMATLEKDGELVGCALQTPPHPMSVTELNAEAIDGLVYTLLRRQPTLSGIIGVSQTIEAFWRVWQEKASAQITMTMGQGIYSLTEVRVPEPMAEGQMRGITQNDFPLLDRWIRAFHVDSGLPPLQDTRPLLEHRLRLGSLFLLENEGPVSMAGWSGQTPNGVRVNAVYTPPEHRRKGYASALVAQLSQQLLDQGREFCFLYTDLANPQSNRIYQRLGYRHISDARVMHFEYPNR